MKYIYEIPISIEIKSVIEEIIDSIINNSFKSVKEYINSISIVQDIKRNSITEAAGHTQTTYDENMDLLKFSITISNVAIKYITDGDISMFQNIVYHELYHCEEKVICFKSEKYRELLLLANYDIPHSLVEFHLCIAIHIWSEYYAYRKASLPIKNILIGLNSVLECSDIIITRLNELKYNQCCNEQKIKIIENDYLPVIYDYFYQIVRLLGTYDNTNHGKEILYKEYSGDNFNLNKACCYYIHDILIKMYNNPWGNDFLEMLYILSNSFLAIFEYHNYKFRYDNGIYIDVFSTEEGI